MPEPVSDTGDLVGHPPSTGYGQRESADDTRQGQQILGNDVPFAQNANSALGTSQNLTIDVLGKNYEAAASRRQLYADALFARHMPPPTPPA